MGVGSSPIHALFSRKTAHCAKRKYSMSLFAGFWLMTGLKGGEWGSTRGHPGAVVKRRVRHNKHSQILGSGIPPERKDHNMKTITQIAVITLAVAASTLLVWSDSGENQAPTIEGVWQVSRVGVNCNDPNQQLGSPFPAIMTFHRDGTLTGAAKSPVTGPFDTPEYGSWQRELGNQNYSFGSCSTAMTAAAPF
jgi:hypothetical protein